MKILFCANIYESGVVGPARLAEGLLEINEWYEGQHEIRILTADVGEEKLPVYKMTVKYPRFLRIFDFLFRGWRFYKNIIRIRKQFAFDVILFGHVTNGLVSKILLKQVFIGGFINDYYQVGTRAKGIAETEGSISLLLLSIVEKWATKKLDFVLVCSEYLRQMIIKYYNCPEQKIFLLYHSIFFGGITFSRRDIKATGVIKILFVKVRHLVGGLPDLAKALDMLPIFNFQLSIIGPDIGKKEEIMDLFKGTSNVQVQFLGKCEPQAVNAQMAMNHILCIPSHLEAQGLANVEGLAHGISVVSSNAGGIPEVLDYGNIGWLGETGNPTSLAAALKKCIMTDSEERMKISKNGRKFAEKHFDHPVMLEKLLQILKNQLPS